MNSKIIPMLVVLLIASIILPQFTAGSFAGDAVSSETVYREGMFGPSIERVVWESGAVTHVTKYPWYYFWEQTDDFQSMNIYGISGSSMSNDINIVCDYGDDPISVTFKQQNDLDFSDSINWFWSSKEVCEKSCLIAYYGLVDDQEKDLNYLTDDFHSLIHTVGPWAYGETWTSTLKISPDWVHGIKAPGSYDFTVQETLYPSNLQPYDTDRAWIHLTVLEDPIISQEIGKGTITVKVLDNLIQSAADVRMYQDGSLKQTVHLTAGEHTFENLPFGSYRFEVVDSDYKPFFYDAFPQQSGYDYDSGAVDLSAERNTISYLIYGDFTSTEGSGYDQGDGIIPDYSNTTTGKVLEDIVDGVTGDDDDGEFDYFKAIIALLASLGLFGIVVLGLPLFIVAACLILVAMYILSRDGDDEN
ncbi:hypothetical protein HNV12_06545 [Methanococcoides sp. SA1]|nr:hypothetical protein [Methanococcoides sp. SA1]